MTGHQGEEAQQSLLPTHPAILYPSSPRLRIFNFFLASQQDSSDSFILFLNEVCLLQLGR